MKTYKTAAVSLMLGVSYWKLLWLFRSGKMPKPQKDISGDLAWTETDVKMARRLLAEAGQTAKGEEEKGAADQR